MQKDRSALLEQSRHSGSSSSERITSSPITPAGRAARASHTGARQGAGTAQLRQGYVYAPSISAATTVNSSGMLNTSLVWEFGTRGAAPLYVIGASDFLVINLNGVTPVSTLNMNIEWDEASV